MMVLHPSPFSQLRQPKWSCAHRHWSASMITPQCSARRLATSTRNLMMSADSRRMLLTGNAAVQLANPLQLFAQRQQMVEHLLDQPEVVDLDPRVAIHILRELNRPAARQPQSVRQLEQDAIFAIDRH